MSQFEMLLAKSADQHQGHLCPRQVLGVRMGLAAGEYLGLAVPQQKKRLLTIIETDGCFADGVAAATGCTVGHRTMRVVDFGKVAATFIDTDTDSAVRFVPRSNVRAEARRYAPGEGSRWHTQLMAYRRMPVHRLFFTQRVVLTTPVEELLSRPGVRVNCERCGEEIINEREMVQDGQVLCQTCAGYGYYVMAGERTTEPVNSDHFARVLE